MAKAGNRQSEDETLGKVWEVGIFCKLWLPCAFYKHILNADLVIIKVFYFLLRLLLCYLCQKALFHLFHVCLSCLAPAWEFVLFHNPAKTNCMISKNKAEEKNFTDLFLEKLCNSHIYRQKRRFGSILLIKKSLPISQIGKLLK